MPDHDNAETTIIRKQSRLETFSDYEQAYSELEPYMENLPVRGTPDGDVFYALIDQMAAYEDKYFPVGNYPGTGNVH